MYVGVLTVVLGWALLLRSGTLFLYALALGTCFQLFIVLYEEPHLARIFGGEYARYRASVARWFPRLGGREKS